VPPVTRVDSICVFLYNSSLIVHCGKHDGCKDHTCMSAVANMHMLRTD
jgi:hypothetical protein